MIEPVIWLLYAAVLYVSIFSLLVFLEKGKLRQEVEWLDQWPGITLVIPAYNEEESIGMTIESALDVDYPEDKLNVIVVDDGSSDRTAEIAEEYTEDKRVELVQQENQGKGGALNTGLEKCETDFMACVDADSRLEENSIKNIVSKFDDDTAAIASAMKVYSPQNVLQKMQWLEYIVGIFMRNILGMINAIYVTPGPLSVYRSDVLKEVGGFDEDSLVEDQEICFRLQKHHWKVGHSRGGEVYTIAPDNIKDYYHQRKRWYRGSAENMLKYREMILNKDYGDFGLFALPQNIMTSILSVAVLLLTVYITIAPLTGVVSDFITLGFQAFDLSSLIPSSLGELTTSIYWQVLNARYVTILMLGALFSISFLIAYLASEHTEEKLTKMGLIPTFIYLAWYVFFTGFVWMIVLIDMITDAERKW